MAIEAITLIRKMRGGSQSLLTLGSDGNFWIVKFQNNPQDVRVLANELIATRLAAAIGLSVPATDIMNVPAWLTQERNEICYELGRDLTGIRERRRYTGGLQFASRLVGGMNTGLTADYLPDQELDKVRNLREFSGILAFDKWTGNSDGRQVVFTRNARERRYDANFIDQGFCFNAGEWTFPDLPLRGIFARNRVYAQVTGWASFEPWLHRIEVFPAERLWNIASAVPPEWYGGNGDDMERLLMKLLSRRSRIRELILSFKNSERNPFPNWGRVGTTGRKPVRLSSETGTRLGPLAEVLAPGHAAPQVG